MATTKKSGNKSNNLNTLNGVSNKFAVLMVQNLRDDLKKSAGFDMFAGKDDTSSFATNDAVKTEKTANLLKLAPNLITFIQQIVENLQDCTATLDKAYLDSVNYTDNGLIAFVRDMARVGRDTYKIGEVSSDGIKWNDKIKGQIELFQDYVNVYAKARNDQRKLQGLIQLSFAFAGIVRLAIDHMVVSPSATYDITDLLRDLLHLHMMNPSGMISSNLLKFLYERQPKPVERKPRVKKEKPAANKVENVQSNTTTTTTNGGAETTTTTVNETATTQSFDF